MRQIEELGKVLANLLDKTVNNDPSVKIDILTEYDKSLDILHELNKLSTDELLNRIQLNEYELSLVEQYCYIIIEKLTILQKSKKEINDTEINKVQIVLDKIDILSNTFSQKRLEYLDKIKKLNQNQD